MAFLAAIDLFVAVIPTDGLVVSTVLLRPRRWIRTFLFISIGSALGAIALSSLTAVYGEQFLSWLFPNLLASDEWRTTAAFLAKWGAIALFAVSISPLPQQAAVALCGLAHISAPLIFLAVLAGRAAKYGAFAWAASHAPRLLKRFHQVEKEAAEIGATDKSQ